jgi:hypothetical protein
LLTFDADFNALYARLSTDLELEQLDAEKSMLHTIVLILKRAINNQTWASINWQLPSPLNALALLTMNRHNVIVVCSCFVLRSFIVPCLRMPCARPCDAAVS